MPLSKGKSEKSFKHNIEVEMKHGKPLKQSLAIAYAMKRKAKKMADGGAVEDAEHKPAANDSFPNADDYAKLKELDERMDKDQKMLDEAKDLKMAHGGEVDEMHEAHDKHNAAAEHKDDLVSRIMAKRMSKGGMVANEDHGHMNEDLADFKQNEFDDLALRDDLEFSYTGANSGDELGDAQEDHDREDIVKRIMKSRAQKDKLPKSIKPGL